MMTAEGPSSAGSSRPTSPRSPLFVPNGAEAGPGPATQEARRARSPSRRSRSLPKLSSASEASNDDEDDYERQRLKRMQENQSLLAELDIFGAAIAEPAPRPAPRRQKHVERRDRYGYIVSLPPPGKRHVLAAIEVRTERAVRRAIDAGEYIDCTHWAAGEERRWRFGWGNGVLEEGEEAVVDGIGPDFRWKEAVEDESEDEPTPTPVPVQAGSPPQESVKKKYSDLPEGTCHQCRRRSDKPKMRCRNIEGGCENLFCETCCRRYYYFDFDEESRSFVCPVCLDKCNCKHHLEEQGLGHLAGKAFRAPGEGLPGETVQHYIERYIENKGREEPPFDRVRLVNMDEDIVAPPLTAEWKEWLEDQRCERLGIKRKKHGRKSKAGGKGKRKAKALTEATGELGGSEVTGGKGKGKGKSKQPLLRPGMGGKDASLVKQINAAAASKKKRKRRDSADASDAQANQAQTFDTPTELGDTGAPILLRFRPPRVREIDSDGDSVRGYSSDESETSNSGQLTTNDFLARMAQAVVPTLPNYPLEGTALGGIEIEGIQALDTSMNVDLSDVNLASSPGHLAPVSGSSLHHLHMSGAELMNGEFMHLPGQGNVQAHTPEPSDLRLTLAPAASLEAPAANFGVSPATPNNRRFAFSELSPPSCDPLPALYPAFPELQATYSPGQYPPYSPVLHPPHSPALHPP
ncbi:hypothetical protein CC85DRAFT_282836 [Cutaneotrichosporon oleaginosum]|uniref:Zinc-finger domain-containing protein n=1 Tax=Cutaneotrichosporon oleaginosum TaxID=879819 RepID=A0A0J0XWC1_9TREE|nr:uncharacterized protein CC85DRAFT_282836 [Cutaneotrichosporon oleaginosum]KLT45348.1 hypothetical protein CC85DRAFT_282836 [Cutaneotrichosporon oleaginosum]TXT14826.1 hypothetical protein COLE_01019 [Cutaneotrichosporon oleaginosum]